MKLHNVIVAYDVYVLAESPEAARQAVNEFIKADELAPNHVAAHPVVHAPIRPQWRDEKPLVASDVSDADFARVKGKTTQQVHDMLFKHPNHTSNTKDKR